MGKKNRVDTTAVNYVPSERGPISKTPQEVSCTLPVLTHWTFDVIVKEYKANFHKGLRDIFDVKRWAWSGMGIATGTKLFSGTSFSEYTHDGKLVDFGSADSVPRNMYTQEFFPNSRAFYEFWKWYFPLEIDPGLNINGKLVTGANVVDAYANTTRIVVHGLCREYTDKIKTFIRTSGLKHVKGFDFAHPASDTLALIQSVPDKGARMNIVQMQSLEELNNYGTRPTGWTAPLGV